MLGSHAIKAISYPKNKELPLLTLFIGSQPNVPRSTKSDVNTAFYSVYLNLGFIGRNDLHGRINHQDRITSDVLIRFSHGSWGSAYHQVGSLNVKTGIPLIKRLYEALVTEHSHLTFKRTWVVGVFVLVKAYNPLVKDHCFNAILGVVPDVPNGTGKPAIATLGWDLVSDDLHNYLRECEENTLHQ